MSSSLDSQIATINENVSKFNNSVSTIKAVADNNKSLVEQINELLKKNEANDMLNKPRVSAVTYACNDILNNTGFKIETITGTTSDGAKYIMKVPSNYVGVVAVFSHGYRFPINVPATLYPGGYTVNNEPEYSIPFNDKNKDFEQLVLRRGVAMIGSGFVVQGWNTVSAVKTNIELINLFKSKYPKTAKVIAWGPSLGSTITHALNEAKPELIDSYGLLGHIDKVATSVSYSGDFLWLFKMFFDNTIKGSGFTLSTSAREPEAWSDLAKLLTIIKAVSKDLTKWPEPLTPIGTILKSQGIPPLVVLILIGVLINCPLKSDHFDGVSTSSIVTDASANMALALVENASRGVFLGLISQQDIEFQCGGVVYDNTKTDYSQRLTNRNLFNFLGTNRDTVLNAILGLLATAPKVTANAEARKKIIDPSVPGSLAIVSNKINKNTLVLTGVNDPVTPVGCTRDLYFDNKKDPTGIGKLQVLISNSPKTWTQFDNLGIPNTFAPPAPGTNHVNFSIDEWIGFGTLLMNMAITGSHLTDYKLTNLLDAIPSLSLGTDEVMTNLPSMFYDVENP